MFTQEARIADKVRKAAREVDVDPSELEFGAILTPERDEQGLYVIDLDETVRYYVSTGDIEPTAETQEWKIVTERAELDRFPDNITDMVGDSS